MEWARSQRRPDTWAQPQKEIACASFLRLSLVPSLPEPNEVEDFELNFTGGVPGPTSQDLLCEIKDSPSPVVLHIEAAFKVLLVGPGSGVGQKGGRDRAQSHSQVASDRPSGVSGACPRHQRLSPSVWFAAPGAESYKLHSDRSVSH